MSKTYHECGAYLTDGAWDYCPKCGKRLGADGSVAPDCSRHSEAAAERARARRTEGVKRSEKGPIYEYVQTLWN